MRTFKGAHKGNWELFGHSHNNLPPFGKSVDVGVDSQYITKEYRPIEFEEVKLFMDEQKFISVDHHNEED